MNAVSLESALPPVSPAPTATADAPSSPAAARTPVIVRPVDLATGVLGWTALAAVSLAANPGSLGAGVVTTLAAPAGALLLTVPALLVGHQFLDLAAPPAGLVNTLLLGFARGGAVALGAVPLALLFAATSELGPLVLTVALLGASLQSLLVTMARLGELEAAWTSPDDWTRRGRMGLLILAWGALYGLIGLRLAFNLVSSL